MVLREVLAIVDLVTVLLHLSTVRVVSNLSVVVEASSHVLSITAMALHQFRGVSWVVVIC